MKLSVKSVQLVLFLLLISACKNDHTTKTDKPIVKEATESVAMASDIGVYDLSTDSKYMEEIQSLNESCPDLMNPQYLLKDREAILESWTALNQNIGQQLVDEGFKWDSSPSGKVKIYHRFYFHKDGSIHRYYFNILDTTVSKEKRVAYATQVGSILKNYDLGIQRDSAFAQCGKMAFKIR